MRVRPARKSRTVLSIANAEPDEMLRLDPTRAWRARLCARVQRFIISSVIEGHRLCFIEHLTSPVCPELA
jgi:hypothetical protein